MNTTLVASHFSLSNDDISANLYSLLFPYDVFDDTFSGNGSFLNTNATFHSYIP